MMDTPPDVLMSTAVDEPWDRSEAKDLSNILYRASPFADADFAPGEDTANFLAQSVKILVVGAGGLGCEILKGLALSGFRNIHVIDMDHIDITNLNRQFLFREKDVGRSKAEVAAEFINRRCGHLGVKVTPYVGPIQNKDEEFYSQFTLIIAGLDNIDARRWLNSTLHGMVRYSEDGAVDPSSIKAMLDGGTEGFKGQSRVIVPTVTSCFECSLDAFPPQVNFPMCTIAETPRLPEHCIEYAMVILWPQAFQDRKYNTDSAEDMQWIFQQAKERADTFNIKGVTYMLTLGVVKRIIPAIASTNALISASLVNEALKLCTYCGPALSTYMMYMGHNGVYTHTFPYEKKPDCFVCGTGSVVSLHRSSDMTLAELLKSLSEDPKLQLKSPSMTCGESVVFIQRPEVLRKQHEYKLSKTLQELIAEGVIQEGVEMTVTDKSVLNPIRVILHLQKPVNAA